MMPRTAKAALAFLTVLPLACTEAPPPDLDFTDTIRTTEVSFDMAWIPDGKFWIGRHEVTWDEYLVYCAFDRNKVPPDADAVTKPSEPLDWAPYDRDWGTGRRPAVGISRQAAQRYCEWLSLNTGREYRLPTEAEWELACGTGGEGPLSERAWFAQNSEEMTQEVSGKTPNEHGLHDMLGNLWEYCSDSWDAENPEVPVLRGGSWQDPAEQVTPQSRLRFEADWTAEDPNWPPGLWWIPAGPHLGFRIVNPAPSE